MSETTKRSETTKQSETTKIVRAIALLLANVNISNAPTPAHEKIAQNIVDDISCMLKGAIGSETKSNPIVESKQEFDIGEYVKSGEIRSTIAMMKAASTKAIEQPVVEAAPKPIPPVVEEKVVEPIAAVVEPIAAVVEPIAAVVEEKVVEEKVVEPIAAVVEKKVVEPIPPAPPAPPKPIPPAPPAPPKPPIPPAPKPIATPVVKEETKPIATPVVKEETKPIEPVVGVVKEENDGKEEEEKALNALSTVRRKSIIRAFMIDKGAKADILRDPRNLTVENAISYADADSFWMYVSSVLG